MSYQTRRILTPTASRKRKEREALYGATSSQPVAAVNATSSEGEAVSNRMLAGYMAYEFMSKGTLLGQKFDPAASSSSGGDWRKNRKTESPGGGEASRSYVEVAHVLKAEGAHIPGVVNPTQLAKWIQM